MKKINNICGEYATMVFNNYYNYEPTLIFYGSNIYDINSSDLDVCIIFKKDSDNIREELIKKTIEFHKLYNLKIDEEIPYDNKLVYDLSLINDILSSNTTSNLGTFLSQ